MKHTLPDIDGLTEFQLIFLVLHLSGYTLLRPEQFNPFHGFKMWPICDETTAFKLSELRFHPATIVMCNVFATLELFFRVAAKAVIVTETAF